MFRLQRHFFQLFFNKPHPFVCSFFSQFLIITTSLSSADVSHLSNAQYYDDSVTSTPAPPHRPYSFGYQAGRYPGHVDRSHQEVSDGSGVVRGAFTYIDPRQQIRTVEYTADKDGFHPNVSPENGGPQQSEAVKLATQRHLDIFNRIAERNLNVRNRLINMFLINERRKKTTNESASFEFLF